MGENLKQVFGKIFDKTRGKYPHRGGFIACCVAIHEYGCKYNNLITSDIRNRVIGFDRFRCVRRLLRIIKNGLMAEWKRDLQILKEHSKKRKQSSCGRTNKHKKRRTISRTIDYHCIPKDVETVSWSNQGHA